MNSLFFVDGHEFGFVCFPYTKEQRERIEARFDFAEEVKIEGGYPTSECFIAYQKDVNGVKTYRFAAYSDSLMDSESADEAATGWSMAGCGKTSDCFFTDPAWMGGLEE